MEMLKKNEIRSQIKTRRATLPRMLELEWNKKICDKVLRLDQIRQAFFVYCYVSFRHEAGTEDLIKSLLEMGKGVAVPKTAGKTLEFYSIHGTMDLEEGIMGIMEPKPSCLRISDPDAPVIVPGIAFDRKGHRIGYGGGFYDRYFEKEPGHLRIAIAYDFQVFKSIETEPHDKGMDIIITP